MLSHGRAPFLSLSHERGFSFLRPSFGLGRLNRFLGTLRTPEPQKVN